MTKLYSNDLQFLHYIAIDNDYLQKSNLMIASDLKSMIYCPVQFRICIFPLHLVKPTQHISLGKVLNGTILLGNHITQPKNWAKDKLINTIIAIKDEK